MLTASTGKRRELVYDLALEAGIGLHLQGEGFPAVKPGSDINEVGL
jgi:hypothetical protein